MRKPHGIYVHEAFVLMKANHNGFLIVTQEAYFSYK